MTTSYSKKIHLSNLFVYYTLDGQVSLSSYMSMKTGLFSFWISVVSLLQFLVLLIIILLWKIKKKSRESKNKLRTIYPKNHEDFKNSKPRVQFFWFLYEKRVYCIFPFKYSKFKQMFRFNFILLSVFLLKHKVCYKPIFLEYTFQIKI